MAGLAPKKEVAQFVYDFDIDGGAVGDIVLDKLLPSGAIVTSGMIHVAEALTSGGSATIALKVASSGDIKAAAAVATYTLNALLDVVPVGTAATSFRVTAASAVTVTIAVAALTAGKLVINLEYYMA